MACLLNSLEMIMDNTLEIFGLTSLGLVDTAAEAFKKQLILLLYAPCSASFHH